MKKKENTVNCQPIKLPPPAFSRAAGERSFEALEKEEVLARAN